jgi:hypothetical protein
MDSRNGNDVLDYVEMTLRVEDYLDYLRRMPPNQDLPAEIKRVAYFLVAITAVDNYLSPEPEPQCNQYDTQAFLYNAMVHASGLHDWCMRRGCVAGIIGREDATPEPFIYYKNRKTEVQ